MNTELRNEAFSSFALLCKLLTSMVFPVLSVDRHVDISVLQVLALVRLDECGSCSLSRLADAVVVSKQSMTVLANDLLKKGYITRTQDPADRRKALIQLTEKGKAVVELRYQKSCEAFKEFLVDFTDEQHQALLDSSRTLNLLLLQMNYQFGENYKKEVRELF